MSGKLEIFILATHREKRLASVMENKKLNIHSFIATSLLLHMLKLSVNRQTLSRFFSTTKAVTNQNHWVNRPPSKLNAGQPLHESRPFLIKPGELTPGITALEYFERRNRLAVKLPAKSCAIIVGSQVMYSSGAVFYPFQQNNDLFYLTGWNEPDSVMILEKKSNDLNDVIFHMIVPPKDPVKEQWDDYRTGVDGVCDIFNADSSTEIKNLSPYISNILKRNDYIYFDLPNLKSNTSSSFFSDFFSLKSNTNNGQTITDLIKQMSTPKYVREIGKLIASFRCIKSEAELRIMRRVGQISARAYNQAYSNRFRNERTLSSFLEYKFISSGCGKSAYIPVVGAGSNALCIHYTRNDDVMYDDEMVLVDAAGSLGGYSADISRTWPVNGKFTSVQSDLYEAVLNVQRKCIDLCKSSNMLSLDDIHEKSVTYMKEELKNVGLSNLQRSDINKLYPHYIGHNLGLDVHDVPSVSRFQPLQPGQVITIEPGVYIPNDSKYPSYFRNIGIRIEDDIAIGIDSYRNLTVEAAKEISDIESIAQNGVTTRVVEDIVSPLQ